MRPVNVLARFLLVPALSATLAASAMQQPAAPDAPQAKPADTKDDAKKKPDLPLTVARTIAFDTDEATWLSLDVTPDGQSIIFELSGDLYRLPMGGGDATRIMEGLPFDAQPRVSPDGKRIAFISDRNGSDNLWIAAIDGTEPRKLSNESQNAVISPAWTPDSQYVIASVRVPGSGTQLRMFHVDGG
ncbi:MAG: amidohydrolase, partial [Acidobacteriota bacterium]|nr:amidohydrolase [Acidobacteriota bacterium]